MKRMSDDVRFRSLGEKEQRSEWEGRLRELQMEIQEREQRNKEEEQKRLQDEERKRIENQKRAGNPFKCQFLQIKIRFLSVSSSHLNQGVHIGPFINRVVRDVENVRDRSRILKISIRTGPSVETACWPCSGIIRLRSLPF